MDELRWILLIVGLLILAGIYFFADPSQRSSGNSRWLQDTQGEDQEDNSESIAEDRVARHDRDGELPDAQMERELERLSALINEDRHGARDAGVQDSADPAISSEPDKIVTLFLRPRGDEQMHGADILEAANNAGLVFGQMHIFHRMHEHQGSKSAIFSLANMMAPGSFEIDRISELSTPGLCLFLALPNQMSALDAWDAMQAAGQRLADLLDAELQDDTQSSLSHQRIAHIRDEMREFDRQLTMTRSGSDDSANG